MPVARNQLCPCGSGKRYKHCHGSDATGLPGLLVDALAAYRAGSLRRAELLYRRVIAERPDDIDALTGLSAVLLERLRYGEALGPAVDAAERTGWRQPQYRQNVGRVLAKLVGPEANARQEALVARFYQRERAREVRAPRPVTVSVVIVARDSCELIEGSIESVANQTCAATELIVERESQAESALSPDEHYARHANRGAARAQGDYLAFLDAGDRYAPDRFDRMIDEVTRDAGGWGFSQVEYAADEQAEGSPGEGVESDARRWDAPADELPGFALRYRDIGGANGNLFVPRSLFSDLGGYREVHHPGWDFCVRAARIVEPVVVERRLYLVGGHDRRRIATGFDPAVQQVVDARRDEILAEALAADPPATNEFSPQFPANRMLVLHGEFRVGRGDRVPTPVLRALAEEWRGRIAMRAPDVVRASTNPDEAARPKVAIVVLGVYRSGTSALTRVLNLSGGTLPDNLMAARLDVNRKGFWESEAIVDLDKWMLKRLGVDWESPVESVPVSGTLSDEFVAMASEVVAGAYGGINTILLKDPRVCVLAPLWHRTLVANGYRPAYVVSVRHPLEVAGSMARSLRSYGGLALPRGLALWRSYMERAQEFVDATDAKVVHVQYDDLLDDWRRVVVRIANRLDVALDVETRAGEIDRFLEPDMRSQRAEQHSFATIVGDAEAATIDALYQRLVERCQRDAAGTLAA